MRKTTKIIFLIFIVAFAGLTALCGLGYRLITRSLPRTQGEITVAGITSKVRVYRDGYGIPHILTRSEHDLFFTQGFITAQDRIWQMDLWRRIARGRLAQIFGAQALSTDSLMLTIGIGRAADRIAETISPETRTMYQAYADGINGYLTLQDDRLPVEFILLGYTPDPWTVADCIAVSRWFAWNLSFGWNTDLTLGALVEKVGPALTAEILPGIEGVSWDAAPGMSRLLSLNDSLGKWIGFPSPDVHYSCSNSWVVSGRRSDTGKPLLANDPHLGLSLPGFWYEVNLCGGGLDVYGHSLPGLPGVIIGNNRAIAWGLTSLMADDMDFFLEKLDNRDGHFYDSGAGRKPLKVIREEIPVRLDSSRTLRILETEHGPIISHLLPKYRQAGISVSLSWTGLQPSDDALAYLGLMRASNWEQFRSALENYHIAPQQFIFADTTGNIGIQAAGALPLRSGNPFLPRLGTDANAAWKGWVPFRRLPHEYNPSRGWIAAANHPDNTSGLPLLPAVGSRLKRIEELLKDNPLITMRKMREMQADIISPYAREFCRHILNLVADSLSSSERYGMIFRRMLAWDGSMSTGSSEATLFHFIQRYFSENTFRDEMGQTLYTRWLKTESLPRSACLELLTNKRFSAWFDNTQTPNHRETARETALKSFKQAVKFLREKYDPEMSAWSWGKLHRLTLAHPLSSQPLLRPTFALEPLPLGGSGTTISAFGADTFDDYPVTWGSSLRTIWDLGQRDNSLAVIPAGQSGQPLDPHYKDQIILYKDHFYHPVLTDTARIRQAGMEMLIINPGSDNE